MSANWLQTVEPGHPVFLRSRGSRRFGGDTYEGAKIARVLKAFVETNDRHKRKWNRSYGTLRGGSYGDPIILDGMDPTVVQEAAAWRREQAIANARLDVRDAMERVRKLPLTAEQCEAAKAFLAEIEAAHAPAAPPPIAPAPEDRT